MTISRTSLFLGATSAVGAAAEGLIPDQLQTEIRNALIALFAGVAVATLRAVTRLLSRIGIDRQSKGEPSILTQLKTLREQVEAKQKAETEAAILTELAEIRKMLDSK